MSTSRRHLLVGMTTLAGVAAAGMIATRPALAQDQAAPEGQTQATSNGDADYVTQTLTVGTLALRTSEIGAQKAQNAAVKEFATLEVAEQQTIATVLSATEAGKTPPELPPEMQARVDELNTMEAGPEFDMAYVNGQIEGHQQLLEIQQRLSGNTDPTVEVITAKLAEQAVMSHLAFLNHLQGELGAQ
jgi:putative membrane protein